MKTSSESKTSSFFGFFSKPAFSFTTAIIIILAVVLIIMNRPGIIEPKDYAVEQFGNNNMFLLAQINFQNIIEGKLIPQLISSNPEEIKNYFISSGIKYSTFIPEISGWQLIGAMISEIHGEKFANHVYKNNNGSITYFFQVEEIRLKNNETIELTSNLLSFLNHGNCYSSESENFCTLMSKANNNIYAVVSNAPIEEIYQLFCEIN